MTTRELILIALLFIGYAAAIGTFILAALVLADFV